MSLFTPYMHSYLAGLKWSLVPVAMVELELHPWGLFGQSPQSSLHLPSETGPMWLNTSRCFLPCLVLASISFPMFSSNRGRISWGKLTATTCGTEPGRPWLPCGMDMEPYGMVRHSVGSWFSPYTKHFLQLPPCNRDAMLCLSVYLILFLEHVFMCGFCLWGHYPPVILNFLFDSKRVVI